MRCNAIRTHECSASTIWDIWEHGCIVSRCKVNLWTGCKRRRTQPRQTRRRRKSRSPERASQDVRVDDTQHQHTRLAIMPMVETIRSSASESPGRKVDQTLTRRMVPITHQPLHPATRLHFVVWPGLGQPSRHTVDALRGLDWERSDGGWKLERCTCCECAANALFRRASGVTKCKTFVRPFLFPKRHSHPPVSLPSQIERQYQNSGEEPDEHAKNHSKQLSSDSHFQKPLQVHHTIHSVCGWE